MREQHEAAARAHGAAAEPADHVLQQRREQPKRARADGHHCAAEPGALQYTLLHALFLGDFFGVFQFFFRGAMLLRYAKMVTTALQSQVRRNTFNAHLTLLLRFVLFAHAHGGHLRSSAQCAHAPCCHITCCLFVWHLLDAVPQARKQLSV